MSFCPSQFSISRTEGLRCTVQFQNTGTLDHSFDVIVLIGTYDPSTKQFNYIIMNYQNDIHTSPGQTATATIDINLSSLSAGTYDIGVLLLDWDPSTGQIQYLYDSQVCDNVLVVT